MEKYLFVISKGFEKDISDWCRVAQALRMYRGAIFGHMGHSYEAVTL